jgi:hypothetical protein
VAMPPSSSACFNHRVLLEFFYGPTKHQDNIVA